MAIRVRRRSAPLQIKLLTGAVSGSSAYFGVTANNLTETLRGLQDTESLQKFAEGDPESFLGYWAQRQKTLSKTQPLYGVLSSYAAKATAKLQESKDDANAIASYAQTNDHKAYLDYLLGKLKNTTDPAKIAALSTQINTLRSRVFAANGGGSEIAHGVNRSDLADAKSDFFNLRDAAREILMNGGTLAQSKKSSPVDLERLDAASKRYGDMLKKVVADTSVSASVRNDAYTQLYAVGNKNLEGTGPLKTIQLAKIGSDQNQIAKSGFDSAGTSSFNAEITTAAARGDTREVARLWASRAQGAEVLLQGLQSEDQQGAVADIVSKTEQKAQQAAAVLVAKAKVLPEAAQRRLDSLYGQYLQMGGQESPGTFAAKLRESPDAETFGKQVGLSPKARQQFAAVFNAAKADATAGDTPTWNPMSQKWEGDPERVQDAKAAADIIGKIMDLPGNIYTQQFPGIDTTKLSESDKVDIALGRFKYQGGYGAGGPQDESARAARIQPNGTTVQPTAATALAQPAVAESSPEPKDVAPTDLATPQDQMTTGGSQGVGVQQPDSNEDFNVAVSGVNKFLREYDIPDLPDFTPPATSEADMTEFFPFANAPDVRSPIGKFGNTNDSGAGFKPDFSLPGLPTSGASTRPGKFGNVGGGRIS